MSEFEPMIETLKAQLETHIATIKSNDAWSQVEKIYRALGTIEELAGTPKTSLSTLFGFDDAGVSTSVTQGEFMGMDALDAAKLYMEKKKAVASSLDEIMEALKKGGAQSVNRDALSLKLSRSTWDVAKAPGQELYTLVKYLPHLKRGKKKSGQTEEPETPTDAVPSAVENGAKN